MEAAFKLVSFRFPKATLNFDIPSTVSLNISFNPSGFYSEKTGKYSLHFDTIVNCDEAVSEVVNVMCEAEFEMKEPMSIENVPDFFYTNSLAILFPYIRAFVSTLSLQANVHPIVLPTVNLIGLTDVLKKNTSVTD